MSTAINLKGHVALVTGGGRRLGRAFAEALANHGASVAVHFGISAKGAEEVVNHAQALGVEAVALQADLRHADQLADLVARAKVSLGKVDLLINNASIFEPLTLHETTHDAWERHMAINLTAPFLLSQAFARQLGDAPGVIVNLLDWRALRPGADHFPYTISKAGLAALTRSLAVALAPSIRVNGLALGAILPPSHGEDDPDAALRGVPIARWATLEETVQAMLFLLAGPDYVTGEILHLDGGRHLI
jgi:NAD(P)-dependent dehydrogenase (short-subunit alcohol dehydrogenase family)